MPETTPKKSNKAGISFEVSKEEAADYPVGTPVLGGILGIVAGQEVVSNTDDTGTKVSVVIHTQG